MPDDPAGPWPGCRSASQVTVELVAAMELVEFVEVVGDLLVFVGPYRQRVVLERNAGHDAGGAVDVTVVPERQQPDRRLGVDDNRA
jgi:hypothetical protein